MHRFGKNRAPAAAECRQPRHVILETFIRRSLKIRLAPTTQSVGPMQQIADWLERLGLGQYAQRFAENDIDSSVLSDLIDQDLVTIGVSLGPRWMISCPIAVY